jgi:hypothetical protein
VSDAAFYCVADRRYFLGAVGLVNSLRLVGHTEPIHLLDCGLTDAQRELLAAEVRLVEGPEDAAPHVLKAIAPLRHPAEVMVMIDTDMIATRSLAPLIAETSGGRVVAFRDQQDRYLPEWGELLGLGASRPGPYVSSGLVVLGGGIGREIVRLLDELRAAVDFDLTFWRRNVSDYPLLYADQDLLNAILRTQVEPGQLVALDQRLAAIPPYRGLRLLDETALRCGYRDGVEPYVVHQYVRKPWLEPMYHGLFSRLFARSLLGPRVALRVPEEQIPLRLRAGALARVERARVDLLDVFRRYVLRRSGA